MQQVRRREPIERQVHVGEVTAANGELAAQIVSGRNTRQHLHRSQRIVGKDAPQILNVGAAQYLLRRSAWIGGPEPLGADRNGLRVTSSAGHRNRDLRDRARGHRHQPLSDGVAHDRRTQPPSARRNCQLKGPVRPCDDG